MSSKVKEILNKQMNIEFYSAHFYLAMASYLESRNLLGFGNYMRVQYQEEVAHALKLFDYILERGWQPKLEFSKSIKDDWKDVIEVFEDTYNHEKQITESITNVLEIAHNNRDYATVEMLQWYVREQVEEEAHISSILEQLKMIDGKGAGLFMLDREMKQRVFIDNTQSN